MPTYELPVLSSRMEATNRFFNVSRKSADTSQAFQIAAYNSHAASVKHSTSAEGWSETWKFHTNFLDVTETICI